MNDKDQKKEDSAKAEIKKQYARLKDNLESAKQKRADMEAIVNGPTVAPLIAEWKREITASKDALANCAPKEVLAYQHSIKARNALMNDFENEYVAEVKEAQEELDAFKKDVRENNFKNALFEAIELEELPEDEQKAAKKAKKGKQAKPSDNVTPIQATA